MQLNIQIRRVLRQQISGEVVDFIPSLSAVSPRMECNSGRIIEIGPCTVTGIIVIKKVAQYYGLFVTYKLFVYVFSDFYSSSLRS